MTTDTKHDEPMKGLALALQAIDVVDALLIEANYADNSSTRCNLSNARSIIAADLEASRPAPALAETIERTLLRRIVAWRDGVSAGNVVRGRDLEAIIEDARALLAQRNTRWPVCNPWALAIDDARVAHGLDCTTEQDNAEESLSQLLRLAEDMALDPAISARANKLINTNIGAASLSKEGVASPDDPLDMPLPCDITVGHGTMRKGVKLRTLVARMKVLYDMAQGQREVVAPGAAQPVAQPNDAVRVWANELLDAGEAFPTGSDADEHAKAQAMGRIAKARVYLRAALNREVEPRTVRMPLKEEQINQMVQDHTWFNGSHAITNYVGLVRAVEAAIRPEGWREAVEEAACALGIAWHRLDEKEESAIAAAQDAEWKLRALLGETPRPRNDGANAEYQSWIDGLSATLSPPLAECEPCGGRGVTSDGLVVYSCSECSGSGVHMNLRASLTPNAVNWKLHDCPDGKVCRSTYPGGCASGWCAHFGVQAETLYNNIVTSKDAK